MDRCKALEMAEMIVMDVEGTRKKREEILGCKLSSGDYQSDLEQAIATGLELAYFSGADSTRRKMNDAGREHAGKKPS